MRKLLCKAVATATLAVGLAAAVPSPAFAITASECLRANMFITDGWCHGAGTRPSSGTRIID